MTATSTQSVEPDLSGQVLDRYRLLRCLGIGGMGAVYEAEHTALGKRVAMKVLRQQFSLHEIARKRFLREARAATRVEHPHVVDISDFGETPDGRIYFVMELLSGRELGELLEAEGRLPWPRVRDLLLQIVSALGAAHSQDIVHRDMKPSNCFLVNVPGLPGRDFVKVLDFGIAKLTGKHGEDAQALTSTDEVFGTVGYMAPEMALGIGNDPRSDVYAVGVMMYRMLAGRLPFEGGTAFQILARHVSEPPIPPRVLEPSIPEGVERVILRAMAKSSDERFGSMAALAEALQRGDVEETVARATVRMDAGMSRERMMVERTASLSSGGIQTGPYAAVGPAGGTEVITDSGAVLSQRLRQLSQSMQRAAVPAQGGEDEVRELEDDERDSEPDDDGREHRGKGRRLLVSGIVVGMAAVLGVIAWMVAPGEGSSAEPVAMVSKAERADAEARGQRTEREPGPELEPVIPEPTRPAEPPIVEDRVPEAPEAAPETTPSTEPSPRADERRRRPAEPTAASAMPGKRRPPKSDAVVAAGARSKILERCRVDGSTIVKVEGVIGTGGKVLSPIVTPQHFSTCTKKAIKSVTFAPGEEIRRMPEISVDL